MINDLLCSVVLPLRIHTLGHTIVQIKVVLSQIKKSLQQKMLRCESKPDLLGGHCSVLTIRLWKKFFSCNCFVRYKVRYLNMKLDKIGPPGSPHQYPPQRTWMIPHNSCTLSLLPSNLMNFELWKYIPHTYKVEITVFQTFVALEYTQKSFWT